ENDQTEDGQEPPTKKPRRARETRYFAARGRVASTLKARESHLFRPVRSIGAVADSLPFSLQTLGDASFLTTSVGRGFQVFECEKLRLAYIGPRFNEKVRALITVGETIITALKQDVVVWHKLTELGRFRGHHTAATVLCAVGSSYLLSAAGKELIVWQLSEVGNLEAETLLESREGKCVLGPLSRLNVGQDFGEVTCIRHPPTYLNKVLVAGSEGNLQLWNLRSAELIHSFKCHKPEQAVGITALMEASGALDVVAVGFRSGRICLMNIREDRILFELQQAQGPVSCIAFRSDDASMPYLVSGAPTGHFVVWDLEKRRMHHVREAHRGPITHMAFVPKEPLLITSGTDNAVKMWIFDTADGMSRYLKGRCGCPGPARKLQFYGEGDKELIVGGGFKGNGFLSKISFIQDQQNKEYSQASLKKMNSQAVAVGNLELPPVVDVAISQVRHYDWPCVVTVHNGLQAAMVWSPSHQALSTTVLIPPGELSGKSPVSAVAVSTCGNYCILGLENGALHKFNLQSGLHRGTIPIVAVGQQDPDSFGVKVPKRPAMAKAPPGPPLAHLGRVCGVIITSSGQVASAASHPKDCCLRLWKLSTQEALESIPLGQRGPSCLIVKHFGVLVACGLDDGTLAIVDLNSKSIVRSFQCGVPATDLAFAPDGRWLAAAVCDGGLRIFDLPAARCIDSFLFAQPALGLCFSPSGAFLVTSHAKNNAIQVWANKFLFDPSLSAPLLRPEPEAPINVEEPGAPDEEEEEPEEDEEGDSMPNMCTSTTPLDPSLLTLSDVPPAKVLATLHLDLVKERNKLKEPPKPLPNAPFFLPTAHEGVTPRFAAPLGDEENEAPEPETTGRRPSLFEELTEEKDKMASLPFQSFLRKGLYDKALEFLKCQTPSGVHLALEQIGPMAGGGEQELEAGLQFFLHHVTSSHFADEVQAYLSLFLMAHGEEIASSKELQDLCGNLATVQEKMWSSLNTRCQKARCFLGMLTQTQSQW
ncbi:WD repeat-containing protein 36 (T-cell activation WD repeat-containing protein) (TA-WDRP), partial [Durusdinium trenchii]